MADEAPRESGAPVPSEPPTEAPPTEAPPIEAHPIEEHPTEAPPTEAPPTEAPPTKTPSVAPPTKTPSVAPPTKTPSVALPAASSETPSEAQHETAPPTRASTEAAPTPAAPPAEPKEEVKEAVKEPEPGAPQPPRDSHAAPAPPGEPSAENEPAAKPEVVHETPEEKKKDSMTRTSSVSFNKVKDDAGQKSSFMSPDVRKSGALTRPSRTSKDPYRRLTSKIRKDSMASIKRESHTAFSVALKLTKYANTYKLYSEKPFNPDKVLSIITKILTETIEDTMTYDAEQCPNNAKLISSLIRTKVKEQEYDRIDGIIPYKLICVVTIGEKKSQDVFTGVRFLWDAERDKYATHMHENMHIFATATVFGIYYE